MHNLYYLVPWVEPSSLHSASSCSDSAIFTPLLRTRSTRTLLVCHHPSPYTPSSLTVFSLAQVTSIGSGIPTQLSIRFLQLLCTVYLSATKCLILSPCAPLQLCNSRFCLTPHHCIQQIPASATNYQAPEPLTTLPIPPPQCVRLNPTHLGFPLMLHFGPCPHYQSSKNTATIIPHIIDTTSTDSAPACSFLPLTTTSRFPSGNV